MRHPTCELLELLLLEWQKTARRETYCTPRSDAWTGAAQLSCTSRLWLKAADEWRSGQISVILESPDPAACYVVSRYPQILSLDLQSCQCFGLRGYDGQPHLMGDDAPIRAILKGCPQLTELTIHNGLFPDSGFLPLETPALNCLHHLRLRGCRHLTGKALLEIAKRCPQMLTLEFSGVCSPRGDKGAITDDTVVALAKSCRQLRSLTLSTAAGDCLTLRSIEGLVSDCRQIELIDLRQCDGLSTPLVALLGRSYAGLHVLRISDRGRLGPNEPPRVTDAALHDFAHGCSQLRELDVSECHGLTEKALVSVAQSCPLRILSIHANAATDSVLLALAACCPTTLRSLHATSAHFTDDGFAELARCCPGLQVLELSYCRGVGSVGLHAVAAHCKDMRELSVYGCKDGVHRAIDAIISACPRLVKCRG